MDLAHKDLLGLKFQDEYFLDRSVPFGFSSLPLIFSKLYIIHYIKVHHGFTSLFNNIDDLIYTGLSSEIESSFFP